MTRLLIRLLLACLCLSGWQGAALADQSAGHHSSRRILFIDTQHRGVPWADQITRAFSAGLGTHASSSEIYFEHLDVIRFGREFEPDLARLIRRKYARLTPEIIVAFGPPALDFALRERPHLAPGVPILYSSITLQDQTLRRLDNAAGLLEMPDSGATLQLAKQMNPQARRLVAVGRMVGDNVQEQFDRVFDRSRGVFPDIEILAASDIDTVSEYLRKLGPECVVLITGWIQDASGVNLPASEVERRVADASRAPVYALWDVTIGHGAVGGKVISSDELGYALGGMAAKLLDGAPVESMPRVTNSPARYIFDYEALQRFDYALDELPADSLVLNRPKPLYVTHPMPVLAALGVIVLLAGGLALTLMTMRVRQRSLARIRASEARYKLLFDENPYPLVVRDTESMKVLAVNRAVTETLGYEPHEIIGKSVLSLLVPGDRDSAESRARAINASIDGGARLRAAHWQCLRRDGAVIDIETFSRAIEFNGKPARLLLVADITARVAAERALHALNAELESRIAERTHKLELAMEQLVQSEKLAALGSVVAAVAHELNTPLGNSLTVVTTLDAQIVELNEAAASNQLRKSKLVDYAARAQDAYAILERNIRRAANLVQSFKQLAVDQSSMRRRSFSLGETVRETVHTVSPTLKKHPVTITESVDERIRMDGYPGAIEQVLTNLLLNAVTHGLEQRPHLHIDITAQLAADDKLVLVVSDDGIGMTQEVVKHAFDPFFTTRLGQGGSGLGLYLVHNLVTGPLGGTIRIDSRPDLGTRFELTLPVTAPAQSHNDH